MSVMIQQKSKRVAFIPLLIKFALDADHILS